MKTKQREEGQWRWMGVKGAMDHGDVQRGAKVKTYGREGGEGGGKTMAGKHSKEAGPT